MSNNQKYPFIVKTLFGLEKLLAEEIESFGGENIEVINRAVSYEGDLESMYKINFRSYFALRVVMPVLKFEAQNEETLYENIKGFPWEEHITLLDSFAIQSVVNSEYFNHSQYVALKTKDAIADRFMERFNKRPNVHRDRPAFLIDVHIFKSSCSVSFDCTGDSLHKRGYRIETGPAPINEVLAAGLIKLSEWDYISDFLDPMCGSGTLLVEAALQACKIPPGKYRKHFLFMNFKNFDRRVWMRVKNEAIKNINKDIPNIYGYDKSEKLLEVAQINVVNSKMDEYIHLKQQDFFKLSKPERPTHIVFNPPYGERMHKRGIEDFYENIGAQLKENCIDLSVWMISSNPEAIKYIGLKPSKKITLYNGKLESKFLKYEMYSGSKKNKNVEQY